MAKDDSETSDKKRDALIKLVKFQVCDTRVEVDFEFTVTDKIVRHLVGMSTSDCYIGLQEPDFGQKKPFNYEFSAYSIRFTVMPKRKGKGKLSFEHNKTVVNGLYHAQEANDAQFLIYQTQEELPLEDDAPPPKAEDIEPLPGTEDE